MPVIKAAGTQQKLCGLLLGSVYTAGGFIKLRAKLRQLDPAATPVKQLHSICDFQTADVRRDRRLPQPEQPSRIRHAARPGCRVKGLEFG
jgi:hypothetical protein